MDQMKKEEMEITISDSDRIECAIRHIQTAVDVDPWAVEIAVEAMKAQLSAEGTTSDLISRQGAIDAVGNMLRRKFGIGGDLAEITLACLPSAQPEIIMCKDCKHKYIENLVWHCPFGLMGEENFFCGYGALGRAERRTDGSD